MTVNKSMANQWISLETVRFINTLFTVPKTPEPRGLNFFSSEGLRIRAWTLVPFSPGPSGSKLCQENQKSQIKKQNKTGAALTLLTRWVISEVSPLRFPDTSSWLSCGGWPGLGGTAHPGKTTPSRKSSQQGHLKLCL